MPIDNKFLQGLMSRSLILSLSWRFLRVSRGAKFASFISWASLVAIALGVACLITVTAVLNGFDRELQDRLLRLEPHALVDSLNEASVVQLPSVVAATQVHQKFLLLQSPRSSIPVMMTAVDPTTFNTVVPVSDYLTHGLWLDADDRYSIVISRLMARRLNVVVGEDITVILPDLLQTPAGSFPRTKNLTVVGLYSSGSSSDEQFVYVPDSAAKVLFRYGGSVNSTAIRLIDPYDLKGFSDQAYEKNITVLSRWIDSQASLFKAVAMEKRITSIVLFAMIAIAAFNVIAALSMQVLNKRRAVAVLRTQGLTRRAVGEIFAYQGLLIGVTGLTIGTILGVLLGMYVGPISNGIQSLFNAQLFDPSVYAVTTLPSEIRLTDVLMIVLCSAILIGVAIITPTKKALTINPTEALNND